MSQYQTQASPMLGLPTGREVVRPSEVISPGGNRSSDTIEECRFCGAHPHAGPEREKWSLDHHCWRCGFRSEMNVGVSDLERRQQFDAFSKWLDSQTAKDFQHATLNPPTEDQEEIDRMKAEIEDMQNKLAARMGPPGLASNKTQA